MKHRHVWFATRPILVALCVMGFPNAASPMFAQAPADAAKAPSKSASKSAAKSASTTPAKPLAKLPKSIDLPPISPPESDRNESTEPVAAATYSLGSLDLDSTAVCVIYLHEATPPATSVGASTSRVSSPRPRFHLEEQPGPPESTRWRVLLARRADTPNRSDSENSTPNMDGTAIAEFERREGRLLFAWLPPAAAMPDAARLTNCLLEISASTERRFVALRKPVVGMPLTFTFDQPMLARWPLSNAPDPALIKVELQLSSRQPRYRFVGSSTISAARGSTWIEFMDRRSAEALKMKVECEVKGGQLQVSATPHFQTPGSGQLTKLSEANYRRSLERAELTVQQLETQLGMLAPGGANGGGGKKAKGKSLPPAIAAARGQLEKQLTLARDARDQLRELAEIQKALDGRTRLLVRATMDTESQSIELLRMGSGDKPSKQ